jgi:peptide-methionine (S)-S-oxide reductase
MLASLFLFFIGFSAMSIQTSSMKLTMKKDYAVFGMGCFWSPQKLFDATRGVKKTQVGYTGGSNTNPTYQSVCNDDGHIEAVRVEFEDTEISFRELVDIFFAQDEAKMRRNAGQYSSCIWTNSGEQERIINKKIRELKAVGDKRATVPRVSKEMSFYVAESYHQDYINKNKFDPFLILGFFVINLTPDLPPVIYEISAYINLGYFLYRVVERLGFLSKVVVRLEPRS